MNTLLALLIVSPAMASDLCDFAKNPLRSNELGGALAAATEARIQAAEGTLTDSQARTCAQRRLARFETLTTGLLNRGIRPVGDRPSREDSAAMAEIHTLYGQISADANITEDQRRPIRSRYGQVVTSHLASVDPRYRETDSDFSRYLEQAYNCADVIGRAEREACERSRATAQTTTLQTALTVQRRGALAGTLSNIGERAAGVFGK